ncbi:2789_t:CDS:1 [Funneliformis geosporum]|uniref:9547_t:CDS:1 n=1 Tax=Funneliformis geosporum TaxID=1117311 RepID=A0A9W4STL7_9GLOM|nr:2789_t:CDS:1 [Funneliformis geosporum]CAI2181118.1 9547_t:CDS:1 [Funneliformis geosporum]
MSKQIPYKNYGKARIDTSDPNFIRAELNPAEIDQKAATARYNSPGPSDIRAAACRGCYQLERLLEIAKEIQVYALPSKYKPIDIAEIRAKIPPKKIQEAEKRIENLKYFTKRLHDAKIELTLPYHLENFNVNGFIEEVIRSGEKD